MKTARLNFSPLEHEYNKKFGVMPDRHFERLLEQGYTSEQASAIRQKNIDGIWIASKIKYSLEKAVTMNGGFVHAPTSPF
ncbi:MAG: hypothetical protein K2N73_15710 [Lachnospiraceae bacterium]|nr:hypothetical protein [Lachnospiraceae bacterium]